MKRKHLTDLEYESLREFLDNSDSSESLILGLCLRTGARQSEVLGLRVQDFEFDTGTVRIQSLKGSEPRRVPVQGLERWETLVKSLGSNPLGSLLSDSLGISAQRRAVQRAFIRAVNEVIPGASVTLHGLRHTFALRCLQATGKDILKVQMIMGHKSISSTAKYLKYLDIEDCRDEILKAVG